jgi:UDP-3-O-[3-hydroxymyristoyl] glucosamine N-acyltransferase
MYSLAHIAQQLGVSLDLAYHDREIHGIQTLHEACENELSFFNDKRYLNDLSSTKAGAVLLSKEYASLLPKESVALITDEPYLKLAFASKLFAYEIGTQSEAPVMGEGCDIDPRVTFGVGVVLGRNVTILAGSYIGDHVHIGEGTLIYPNVSIYHHTQIGTRCILHSGSVIGSDGYGFAHTKQGEHVKIYQNGNVVIEDSVEIGANSTIDRAVFGQTRIAKGSKLDNLIQIAHNCELGEHTLLAAQVGLAGSTRLGRNVVMGGQSATAGHLSIGNFATVAGKGGVTKSLEGGRTYAGFPAIEHTRWLKIHAKIARLWRK